MYVKLIGILNLTPDSFSDGGQYKDAEAVRQAIAQMAKEGAPIIDIGAESTRPGATPLSPAEEWQRLEPILGNVLPTFKDQAIKFSLDTRHPETASAAMHYNIHWINDVSGFTNPAMIDAVCKHDCRIVVMHSLSIPANPSITIPEQYDPVEEILAFAKQRIAHLQSAGIERERIIFDPGIGFNKTPAQSLAILRRVKELQTLGVELMIGHSRKSYLTLFTDAPSNERDLLTVLTSCYLDEQQVDYVRVHNVRIHYEAFQLRSALYG